MAKTDLTDDSDFRTEAVNLLLNSGRPLKRVAAELGVSANSLRSWRDKALGKGRAAEAASAEPKGRSGAALADPAGEPTEGRSPAARSPKGGAQRPQIRRLQRENEYLRRQREILKKAVSILPRLRLAPAGLP